MIHLALWILSTLFVVWFFTVCGTLLLAFVAVAWRWLLGVAVVLGLAIFVNARSAKVTEEPTVAYAAHISRTLPRAAAAFGARPQRFSGGGPNCSK